MTKFLRLLLANKVTSEALLGSLILKYINTESALAHDEDLLST